MSDTVTIPTDLTNEIEEQSPVCCATRSGTPCPRPATWGAKGNCCNRTTAMVCDDCCKRMHNQDWWRCTTCDKDWPSADAVFTWWRI